MTNEPKSALETFESLGYVFPEVDHLSDGGQPDKEDSKRDEGESMAERIARELRQIESVTDHPGKEFKLLPKLSATGTQAGGLYQGAMALPSLTKHDLELMFKGQFGKGVNKRPEMGLGVSHEGSAIRGSYNPHTKSRSLEVSHPILGGQVTAGASKSPYGAKEWKVAFEKNFDDGGSVKATPIKNRPAHGMSQALHSLHQFVSKPFGLNNPPGEMISEALGIPATARTLERLGYGEPLTTGKGMTTKPRADTMDAAMAVAPLAPLTKGMPVGAVIKNKGGNWLQGEGGKDLALKAMNMIGLKRGQHTPKDLLEFEAYLDNARKTWAPERQREVDQMYREFELMKQNAALNEWVDKNLVNYYKNEMATPEDRVRLGIDRRAKEIREKYNKDIERADRMAKRAESEQDPRRKANMDRQAQTMLAQAQSDYRLAQDHLTHMEPREPHVPPSLRKKRAEEGFDPQGMGVSEEAQDWESRADVAMRPRTARQLRADAKADPTALPAQYLENNPWVEKLDPEARLYNPIVPNMEDLGFNEIVDRLRKDMADGKLTPDQLKKVTVDQAVERTANANLEEAKFARDEAVKQQGMFPVHKEYPEGYKWIELKAPNKLPEKFSVYEKNGRFNIVDAETGDPLLLGRGQTLASFKTPEEAVNEYYRQNPKVLADALKYEGDTMGHCVGGYCPDVLEGRSRIFSLRDAKGEPHATIELQPNDKRKEIPVSKWLESLTPEKRSQVINEGRGSITEHPEYLKYIEDLNSVPIIKQIKGKQNRGLEDKYTKYAHDFVRSGDWSEVKDLHNIGMRESKDVFNDAEMQKIRAAGLDVPKYITPDEIKSIGDQVWPGMWGAGMKDGGSVNNEGLKMNNGGASFGNPNIQRQGAKARASATANPSNLHAQAVHLANRLERLVTDPAGVAKEAAEQAIASRNEIWALTQQAYGDPKNPLKVTDPEAARQLNERYTDIVTNFAPLGMTKPVKGGKSQRAAAPKSVADVFEGVTDPAEAMKIAQAGKHLKIDPKTGKYIGLGSHIDSPQALGGLRGRTDKLVQEGAYNADWYLRQKQLAKDLSDVPAEQSLFARGTAAYSPQAMPKVELPAFLRQHNEKMLTGENAVPRTESQSRNVAQAYTPTPGGLAQVSPEKIRLGKKTGPYANKKDPTVPVDYKTANDIWHARAFELGEPGVTFDRGLTPQEHGVLHGENLLLADRANKAGVPVGSTEGALHDASTAQAATWAAKRYRDLEAEDIARFNKQTKARNSYEKNPVGWRKAHPNKTPPSIPQPLKTPEELRAYASQGLDTAMPNQTAYLTKEAVTGARSGHLPGMPDWPMAEKEAYTNQMRDLTGRDPTIEALGMYSKKPVSTVGEYTNSLGQTEVNPGWQNEVAVSNEKVKGVGRNTPDIEREALDVAAHTDALLGAQEAGAWSRFHPEGTPGLKVSEMSALGVDTSKMSPELRQQLADFAHQRELDQIDYGNRVALTRFGDEGPVPGIAKGEAKELLESKLPVKFQRGRAETGYVPALTKWDDNAINPQTGEMGAMRPTIPESGEATTAYLNRLDESKIVDLYEKLDASRWRNIAQAKNEIDQAIADAKGLPVRKDLLKLRQLINEVGFSGLRDYVKKFGAAGLPAVAGLELSGELPSFDLSGETE